MFVMQYNLFVAFIKCKEEKSGQDVVLLGCLELRCCVLFHMCWCGFYFDINIELF